MGNELSHRLLTAVNFLKANGMVKYDCEIARKMGVGSPILSMMASGKRKPSWDALLKFCDNYPINFWWLRSGTGDMVRMDKEAELLKRIEELENKVRELEEKC